MDFPIDKMVIFNSYVKLPEGNIFLVLQQSVVPVVLSVKRCQDIRWRGDPSRIVRDGTGGGFLGFPWWPRRWTPTIGDNTWNIMEYHGISWHGISGIYIYIYIYTYLQVINIYIYTYYD